MAQKTVTIPNISCEHCVRNIETELGDLSGVDSVSVDLASKTVTIIWSDKLEWSKIEQLLHEINYPPAI
jgi:copper chaperone CopZ